MNQLNIHIEKPRLGVPVSLVVDDPTPCLNPFYYYRLQVNREGAERHEARIPLDFLEQFADVCGRHGVRGKFSVLPYPAGLGSILDGWPGCDRAEIEAWLELARERIAPDFDITPEILTHTRALDLATGALLEQSEQDWMAERTASELKQYFDAALRILVQAGFTPAGITQPVEFTGSHDVYARATMDAIRECGGPSITYFFMDPNYGPPPLPEPKVVLLDRERGEAVVDMVCYCDDHFWPTQNVTRKTAEQVVDKVITDDGSGGRLAELAAAGAWLVWVCHWQTLYSDGRREGLKALDEIATRLRRAYGSRLLWLKLGEVARYRAAAEACSIEALRDGGGWTISFDSAFDCPDWTVSLAWPDPAPAQVTLEYGEQHGSQPLAADPRSDVLLTPSGWRYADNHLYLCFNLHRGRQVVRIEMYNHANSHRIDP